LQIHHKATELYTLKKPRWASWYLPAIPSLSRPWQ
jgi:hypothetical protein